MILDVLFSCLCCLCNELARPLKTPKAAYRTLRKAVGTKQGVAGLTPWPFFVDGRACGTQQIMVMYTFILVCFVCNKLARTNLLQPPKYSLQVHPADKNKRISKQNW